MSAPVLNLPLAEAVLKQVLAHPETHKQDTYGSRRECGSVHCISGWAAVLSGAGLSWVDHHADDGVILEGVRLPGHDAWSDPFHAGMELLGLDEDQAFVLFDGHAGNGEAIAYLTRLIASARQVSA